MLMPLRCSNYWGLPAVIPFFKPSFRVEFNWTLGFYKGTAYLDLYSSDQFCLLGLGGKFDILTTSLPRMLVSNWLRSSAISLTNVTYGVTMFYFLLAGTNMSAGIVYNVTGLFLFQLVFGTIQTSTVLCYFYGVFSMLCSTTELSVLITTDCCTMAGFFLYCIFFTSSLYYCLKMPARSFRLRRRQ